MHIEQLSIETDVEQLSAAKVLWVDSTHIGFYEINAPEVPKRRWQDVLPWSIDEQSLLEPETQHLIYKELAVDKNAQQSNVSDGAEGNSSPNKKLALISTPIQMMDVWKEQIESLNDDALEGKPWCPDVLALPYNPQGWSIWQRSKDECLVRTGMYSGFVIQQAALQALLKLQDKRPSEQQQHSNSTAANNRINALESIDIYQLYSHNDLIVAEQEVAVSGQQPSEQQAFQPDLENISVNYFQVNDSQWPFNEGSAVVNLLQGVYKPAFDFRKKVIESPKLSGYLAMAAVLLLWIYIVISTSTINQQTTNIDKQVTQQLGQFFVTRVDPRISQDKWLQRIERDLVQAAEVKNINFWSIFRTLDPLISSCNGRCQVTSVNVKSLMVDIHFKGEENALASLRKRLLSINIAGLAVQLPKAPDGSVVMTIERIVKG